MEARYRYPGDPITPIVLTYGGDFRAANPNRAIEIGHIEDGRRVVESSIPVEEIICDVCNAEVTDYEPCALTPGRLYCWTCYREYIRPYLLPASAHA